MPDFMAFAEGGLEPLMGIVLSSAVILGSEQLGRENVVVVVNKSSFVKHDDRVQGR